MEPGPRFDARIAPLTLSVKDMPTQQTVFYDKAANVRAERMTVDFGRARVNHIVFASGTHRCLGSHLARLEMKIGLEELLTRLPDMAIAAGGELVYDNVAVRTVTHFPITFTPKVIAAV